MALLPAQLSSADGVDLVYTPATAGAGDSFHNGGREFLHVVNGGVAACVVTIDSPATCSFGITANPAHDDVVSVPAASDRMIGPFSKDRHNSPAGIVTVTYSVVASVTVAVIG